MIDVHKGGPERKHQTSAGSKILQIAQAHQTHFLPPLDFVRSKMQLSLTFCVISDKHPLFRKPQDPAPPLAEAEAREALGCCP